MAKNVEIERRFEGLLAKKKKGVSKGCRQKKRKVEGL